MGWTDAIRGFLGPKLSVLIVDDEKSCRELGRIHFENAGWKVTVAADGDEALALIRSGKRFDLHIFDIFMRGMNGLDLAHEIRKEKGCRFAPLFFITGGGGREEEVAGVIKRFPRSRAFLKPCEWKSLLAQAAEVCGCGPAGGDAKGKDAVP